MRGSLAKGADIDLGLAVSALSLSYGQTRSHGDLAAFCGCGRSNIQHIENNALRKLRRAIFMRKDQVLIELMEHKGFKNL